MSCSTWGCAPILDPPDLHQASGTLGKPRRTFQPTVGLTLSWAGAIFVKCASFFHAVLVFLFDRLHKCIAR
jgi:hypothetical protein